MKKLLLVVILLGLSSSFPVCAQAGTGFQLEKASLDYQWSDADQAWKSVYLVNSGADWEWLKLGFSEELDNPGAKNAESTLKLAIDFPKLWGRPGFDAQYSWDDRYLTLNTGVSYTPAFGDYFQAVLAYENQQKEGIITDSKEDSRQVDEASITLNLEYASWKYQIKYLGQINDYLNTQEKNCTQTDLDQNITWRPRKDLNFKLYYQETTHNYPEDHSSNSWEAKYGLQGAWKVSERWQWFWDYYRLEEEKNVQIEERQSLSLELKSELDKNNQVIAQISSGDGISYFDQEYQSQIPKDDPRLDLPPAAPTLKLTAKYLHKFGDYSVEFGSFYSEKKADTSFQTGVSASLDWKYQQLDLALKVASTTENNQSWQYNYGIKLSYAF
ncbi:MAG TPA: hypothetical protein VHY08_18070 [Bacillota bacterium]|nr:hypothetical protein [Bacillota bacterium]